MKIRPTHAQIVKAYLVVYDFIAIVFSYFTALFLRFDCSFDKIPVSYLHGYYYSILVYVLICHLVFVLLKLYRTIWRFAGYYELYRMTIATAICFVVNVLITCLLFTRMPISYYLFGILIQFCLTLGIRFSYRFVRLFRGRDEESDDNKPVKRIMLFGAGESGQMILRDIKGSKELHEKVYCILDDNPNKWHRFIDGQEIFGGRDLIFEMVNRYSIDKIYVAIPSATPQQKRDILNICKETGCELRNLPGMYQFATGEISVSKMKEVAIEDLLGRDTIKVNMDEIFNYIKGKRILVTGGGGSIGSELCRQIAAHEPEQLIIFDIYENNAYDIQLELQKKYPQLNLETLIGSVRDSRKIFQVFEKYHPQIVFHAAAHKHVPLMEDSPCEAIKNNAIGTYKTAYAAMSHGAERFVLISTDKAVNPTNIMGFWLIIKETMKISFMNSLHQSAVAVG